MSTPERQSIDSLKLPHKAHKGKPKAAGINQQHGRGSKILKLTKKVGKSSIGQKCMFI